MESMERINVWRRSFLAILTMVALLGGCRRAIDDGPATVPLSGRIEFSSGGSVKDLADQSVSVQFESVDQPEVQAFGSILEDGTFTMATQTGTAGKLGVIPGKHKVRLNADETAARLVHRRYLSYETSGITVEAPASGELKIKLAR